MFATAKAGKRDPAPAQGRRTRARGATGGSRDLADVVATRRGAAPVQARLTVGAANDRFEKEADSVASSVASGAPVPPVSVIPPGGLGGGVPAAGAAAVVPPGGLGGGGRRGKVAGTISELIAQRQVRPDGNAGARADGSGLVDAATRSPGAGQPLDPGVRRTLESGLGVDLAHVQVHTDATAQQAAASLGARAFTRGARIYLGAGESPTDTALLAHEATHVVQQGAAAPAGTSQEAGQAVESQPVQRSLWSDITGSAEAFWDAASGAVVDAAGAVVAAGADLFWGVLERLAPALVPVLREISSKGILGFLEEKISQGFAHVFDRLSNTSPALAAVLSVFVMLVARAREVLGALVAGDCEPLFAAVRELRDVVTTMAGEVWSSITAFFEPIGAFFSGLWQSFGAPVVDWLGQVAGDVWESIKALGAEIWSWTSPVRDAAGAAWDWVKDKIGIGGGEGGESEGGLIGWVKDQAETAWGAIQQTLQPVIEPIQAFAARVREVLPLDAILNLRDTIQGWLEDVGSMAQSLEADNGVVEEQASLRDEILPAVMQTIQDLGAGLVIAGQWVAEKIGAVSAAVAGFMSTLLSVPLLAPVSGAIQWVADSVQSLTDWAMNSVVGLFGLLAEGLARLARFVRPVYDTLMSVVEFLGDLVGKLPDLIFGPFFLLIPACIRDPIKDFILHQILARIPIFAQLIGIPDLWQNVRNVALTILRQVFIDGDLVKAAWTFFSAMLRLIGLPPELVTGILARAASALGAILGDPIGFIINVLRATKEGFRLFFANIGNHLLNGISGWLFGQMERGGITPPADLTLGSILGVVMQILGITRDNVFARLARRIGQAAVDRLRAALDVMTGVWEWVSTLITEGPAGLWRMLTERLSDLWNVVLNSAIGWVTRVIIANVTTKLLSMLDPSGIMAVIQSLIAIYRAIETFVEQLRAMLEIVHNVLGGINELALGVIAQAAALLETAMAGAIPVIVAFLANQVGLGNLGERIQEMVCAVRERVNAALDWLIDRALRVGSAVLRRLTGRSGTEAEESPEGPGEDSGIGERMTFNDGHEDHTLWIERSGDQATVRVASDPQNVLTLLSSWRTRVDSLGERRDAAERTIDAAEGRARQIDRWSDDIASGAAQSAELEPSIVAEEQRLRCDMIELFRTFAADQDIAALARTFVDRPFSDFQAAHQSGPLGAFYTIDSLERIARVRGHAAIPGELPQLRNDNGTVKAGAAEPTTHWELQAFASHGPHKASAWLGAYSNRPGSTPSSLTYYGLDAKGHLIGAQFGGPGSVDNMAPMQREVNSPTFSVFESALKARMIETQKAVRMRVEGSGSTSRASWEAAYSSSGVQEQVKEFRQGHDYEEPPATYLDRRPTEFTVIFDEYRPVVSQTEFGASVVFGESCTLTNPAGGPGATGCGSLLSRLQPEPQD